MNGNFSNAIDKLHSMTNEEIQDTIKRRKDITKDPYDFGEGIDEASLEDEEDE